MTKPRILLLDIETAPALAYVWRLRDENIGLDQLIEPSRIISVGWKWLREPTYHYADVWPMPDPGTVSRSNMLYAVHGALSEADAVVTFNGAHFDLPKLTGEFAVEKFKPVPPIAHIDLYKTTRKMGFTSGKLAHVAPLLGCGNKRSTGGFRLWRNYMAGDPNARAKMRLYNERDVRVLERLYKRILPFITDHAYIGERSGTCPACGSSKVQHRGWRRTRAFRHERLHCQSCGHWSTGKRTKI